MTGEPSPEGATAVDALSGALVAWRLLRASGDVLASHASACVELLLIEWQEERARLLRMVFLILLAVVCLLLLIGFTGVLALAAAWDTPLRVPVAAALLLTFAVGAWWAWSKSRGLGAVDTRPFSAFREELAKDLALAQLTRRGSDGGR